MNPRREPVPDVLKQKKQTDFCKLTTYLEELNEQQHKLGIEEYENHK